ncbi:MAG: hypothetical protein WCY93_07880 [Anaerolineaceae bacterium]
MKLTIRELSFVHTALEKQIASIDEFHRKIGAGDMPGYDEYTYKVGKEYQEDRKALLARINEALDTI